jgi:hypothetical protein
MEAMTEAAEAFHTKAAECDRLADKAQDPEAKRMYHEAAANWRAKAERAELGSGRGS